MEAAIAELASSFESLKVEIARKINAVADAATEVGIEDIARAQAPDGVLARAEVLSDRLRQLMAECDALEMAVAQAEQVYLISNQLREVVMRLERDPTLR